MSLLILPRMRAEALGRLAYFLAHEEESLYKLPLFSELDMTNLANLLIVDTVRVLDDEDTGRSVFQVKTTFLIYQYFKNMFMLSCWIKKVMEDFYLWKLRILYFKLIF